MNERCTQAARLPQRATARALSEIASLAREVLQDAWSQAAFEAHSRVPKNDLWWIAGCDGRVAGYLAARHLDDEGEILSLGVSESARRQGLASALLNALETSQEWRSVRRVHLEVRESNHEAQKFYARHGFAAVGKRPRYYADGETAVLMTRDRVQTQSVEGCAGAASSAQRDLPIRAQAAVVENRREAGAQHRLRIRVAHWPAAQPGQFVMLTPKTGPAVACTDPLLPRPMAIYRVFEQIGVSEIEILYRVVGRGTGLLAEVLPGETIGIVGPLGRGFPAPKPGEHSILVGGGSGIASLYGLAQVAVARMREAKAGRVTVLLGARTAVDLMARADFQTLGAELILATEDGSDGVSGLVTAPLQALLEAAKPAANLVLYVCGPTPMMRACAKLAAAQARHCWVSLENPMACGFGVCLGCATALHGGGKALVCKDGPVFAADRIDWENAGG